MSVRVNNLYRERSIADQSARLARSGDSWQRDRPISDMRRCPRAHELVTTGMNNNEYVRRNSVVVPVICLSPSMDMKSLRSGLFG